MKRIVLLILCLILSLNAFPAHVFAEMDLSPEISFEVYSFKDESKTLNIDANKPVNVSISFRYLPYNIDADIEVDVVKTDPEPKEKIVKKLFVEEVPSIQVYDKKSKSYVVTIECIRDGRVELAASPKFTDELKIQYIENGLKSSSLAFEKQMCEMFPNIDSEFENGSESSRRRILEMEFLHVFAESLYDIVTLNVGSLKIFNNDERLQFKDHLPFIVRDRILVPANTFLNQVNAEYEDKNTLNIHHNKSDIIYYYDENDIATINGLTTDLEVSSREVTNDNGTEFYIPMRFTAENYNGYVHWVPDEQAAYITDDQRSKLVSNVKKHCYNFKDSGLRTVYLNQQKNYEQLINNDIYTSYLFMKEYSEFDTSSFGAFMADIGKKALINIGALALTDEKWERLFNLIKSSAKSNTYTDMTDGVDQVEKRKYKDGLNAYIRANIERKKALNAVDIILNNEESLNDGFSSSNKVYEFVLSGDKSDTLKNIRKELSAGNIHNEINSGNISRLNDITFNLKQSDIAGKVYDAAGYAYVLTDGVIDMIEGFASYDTCVEYIEELETISNNSKLPQALREAAAELKDELKSKSDYAFVAPIKNTVGDLMKEGISQGVDIAIGQVGSLALSQVFAGVNIAEFISNAAFGYSDFIDYIAYIQMWGFLQESETENLIKIASEFNTKYNEDVEFKQIYKTAKEFEESFNKLKTYRTEGEKAYKSLKSSEFSNTINFGKILNTDDEVTYVEQNITNLNSYSLR